MLKKCKLVVRDEIFTCKPKTDDTLRALDCYYESPIFYAKWTTKDLDIAVDKYLENFKSFRNWIAQIIMVEYKYVKPKNNGTH